MKKLFKLFIVLASVAIIAVMMVACAPSNLSKAEKKMWDEDYSVEISYDDVDGITGEVGFIKAVDGNDVLEAYLFKNTSDAKAFYKNTEGFFNKTSSMRVIREGKWVICATNDAYEDFMD